MIDGEKLLNDTIEVLEEDHVDYITLSEKFGHSKEIVKKSATIKGRFFISTTPLPHILPWRRRQRTKIRRFQDFDHLHQSAQNLLSSSENDTLFIYSFTCTWTCLPIANINFGTQLRSRTNYRPNVHHLSF